MHAHTDRQTQIHNAARMVLMVVNVNKVQKSNLASVFLLSSKFLNIGS